MENKDFSKVKVLDKWYYKVSEELTKDSKTILLLPSEVRKLAELIYTCLNENLPSLKLLSNYFDGLIKILLKLDLPVVWITPLGLKISLSTLQYKKERDSSSLLPYGKPVTISIPTKRLNTRQIRSSFMPNLIHSLDASNIHLLCNSLKNIPLYTVHDCFASTANNMSYLETRVKSAFIEIYFKDESYIEKMHNNLIEQIKSYKQSVIVDGEEFVEIGNKKYKIPEIPKSFLNKSVVNKFIEGINRSKFFIS